MSTCRSVQMNSDGYEQLSEGFEAFNLNYIPSFANFIAVEFDDAMVLITSLLKEGVIVRPVEMKDYLRISIGTRMKTTSYLKLLKKFYD